jgi:hypothetical protein
LHKEGLGEMVTRFLSRRHVARRRRFGAAWLAGCTALAGAALAATGPAGARDEGWTGYRDGQLGFSFSYPADIFAPHQADPTAALQARTAKRSGRTFQSKDGRAWLQAAAFANIDKASLAAYKARAATSYVKARITYDRLADEFFVLSGFRGKDIFYERVIFSCGGKVINVWTLTYPATARATYDRIVEEIARSFRPVAGRENCS